MTQVAFPTHQPTDEAKPLDAFNDALKAVIDSGICPSTAGSVGNKWNRAKQDDAKLRADYEAEGKSYKKQNAFRVKWCTGLYDETKTQRVKTTTFSKVTALKGQFEPPNQVWVLEGKGAVGLTQVNNLALMCCSVGSKFISYNTSSKCVELMVTKKGFREELEEKFAIIQSQNRTQKGHRSDDAAATVAGFEGKAGRVQAAEPVAQPKSPKQKPATSASTGLKGSPCRKLQLRKSRSEPLSFAPKQKGKEAKKGPKEGTPEFAAIKARREATKKVTALFTKATTEQVDIRKIQSSATSWWRQLRSNQSTATVRTQRCGAASKKRKQSTKKFASPTMRTTSSSRSISQISKRHLA